MSSGICEQRRPRSACTSVQSDQGLLVLQPESLDTIECINVEQKPWRSCLYARWRESAHFTHAQRHFFTWPGLNKGHGEECHDKKYKWAVLCGENNSYQTIHMKCQVLFSKKKQKQTKKTKNKTKTRHVQSTQMPQPFAHMATSGCINCNNLFFKCSIFKDIKIRCVSVWH